MQTSSVTSKELADFDRNGFVVFRGMYSRKEMEDISSWTDEIATCPPRIGREMAYFEDSLAEKGKRILSRIEKFVDEHEGFRRLVYDPRIIGTASALLGEEAVLFKEKINYKLPGGGGFAPHQDIQPGWDDYAPFFISVLVTIDRSTVRNGCLELAAGHHKRGLLGEKWKPLDETQLAGIEFVKYPMEPGDAAFFDCFVPHQSLPNLTDKPRRNLYLTFNRLSDGDCREKYFADKRKSFPPDIERKPGREYRFRV